MENKHQAYDLAQMQSLPLEAKIRMTKERIKAWYESWTRFEICDGVTGKTRFVTIDTRHGAEPTLKETEYIVSAIDGQVYVSFSGGKDSTVLKHIVDSMYDDVPALFVNTGLEYPEIQKFAMSQKNVITVRPEMRFDEVIKKYGYPVISKEVAQTISDARKNVYTGKYTYRLKKLNGEAVDKDGKPSRYNIPQYKYLLDAPFLISHKCCDVMKKEPAKQYEKQTGRKAILGTMAYESQLRKTKWQRFGCNAFESIRPTSQPLSFWTEQDILHYIKYYIELPLSNAWYNIYNKDKRVRKAARKLLKSFNYREYAIATVYGKIVYKTNPEQMRLEEYTIGGCGIEKLTTTGCDRTGCIFCMFGCHLEKGVNRFQRLKETHPRQYEYSIGGGETIDGKWQPNKQGLGLGKVLDYIGVKYD